MAGLGNHERLQRQGDSEDPHQVAASSRDAGLSLEQRGLQGCTQLAQSWLELLGLAVVLEAVEEEEVGLMLGL